MENLLLRNKKIVKVGESYGFTIDMAYIKNGHVDLKNRYEIIIKESKGVSQ